MTNISRIDWVHPSCRDLVIEELSTQPDLQTTFLQSMSLQGIKLAISDSGGATGERQLPLMNHDGDWDILKERCLHIVRSNPQGQITDLLTVLVSAMTNTSDLSRKEHLYRTISSVCQAIAERWNREAVRLQTDDLLAYCEASLLVTPFIPIPNLEASWAMHLENARTAMDDAENYPLSEEPIRNWVKFMTAIDNNEPRFLRAKGFPIKMMADISRLITIIDSEIHGIISSESAEDYDAEAERLESIKEAFDSLAKLFPWDVEEKVYDEFDPRAIPPDIARIRKQLITYSGRMRRRIDSLKESSAQLTPPEPDYDGEGHRGGDDFFDIDGLFSDL
jgi:hypothetical protein